MSESPPQSDTKALSSEIREQIKQIVYDCLREILQEASKSAKPTGQFQSSTTNLEADWIQGILQEASKSAKPTGQFQSPTTNIGTDWVASYLRQSSGPQTNQNTSVTGIPSQIGQIPQTYGVAQLNQPYNIPSDNTEQIKKDLAGLMSKMDSKLTDLDQIKTKKSSVIGL